MSTQWQSPPVDGASRPVLPPGAITQANAVAQATRPTTVPTQSVPVVQAAANSPAASTSVMSNGVMAPNAPVANVPVANKAVPNAASPSVNVNGKRELSPDRSGAAMPPAKTVKAAHGEDAKPVPVGSPDKLRSVGSVPPMGKGNGIDLRAEEEAARRAFARSAVGNIKFAGNMSRARNTDLFGEVALRTRLNQIAQQHGMTVDDEAMRYLAMAAEVRVRALLSSAIRAQQHRVSSSHQHKPPMSSSSGSKTAQPLWSQKITSDAAAVMSALSNANKEDNKAHRIARTERNARETELARAAAAAREREREREGSPPPAVEAPAAASSGGGPGSEGENSPAGGSGAASAPAVAAAPARPAQEPTFQAAPTFGAPPPPRKTGKGKKAANRDMSAEAQAKMTNQTAHHFTSGRRKKYAWETGGGFRPQVSSPLSRPGKKKGAGDDAEGEDVEGGEGSTTAAAAVATETGGAPRPAKKKRAISGPHRRPIDVDAQGDKRARDDTALTLVDFVFAMEHEGSGRGVGTVDEIVRRVWSRPGGPYGNGKW